MTIISATAGTTSSRALNGQKNAVETADVPGIFAALLGGSPTGAGAQGNAAGTGAEGKIETEFQRLARLALEAATGQGADKSAVPDDVHAEPIAATLDLQTATATHRDPAALVELVDALTALKTGLDSGEPVDPDLFARVDTALDTLAQALGLDLAALPVPQDMATVIAKGGESDASLAGMLSQLLAPLSAAAPAPGSEPGPADEQIKALGEKLAALLAAVEDNAISQDKLDAIGMKPGTKPAEEIEAAMNRFAALLKSGADVPEEPELATPTLKTTEPVIAGKVTDTSADAAPASKPDAVSLDTKPRSDDAGQRPASRDADVPRREAPPATPTQQAPVNQPDAPAAQAAQDNGVLRIDPATGPRVIQAGYQTSQQQLNLPQIAFELARQVQDGNTRFQIRLDPPELGKIDVRLDIDKSGQVHARLTVEKSETLDLMQRDQRALERALQQAGLDGSKTNLEFSLKQNPFAGQERGQRENTPLFGGDEQGTGDIEQAPSTTVNLYRGSLQASGVNIIA
ncbi:hypothetical protein VE26_11795 [Devosia chinhatensis]|uniref:Flagellar hook-length control protein-like C-terminal domain-containing protein n=1 Tax=Devosia chinhatensis TaxID=429727 RepID=A0A0F5FEU6_9HYPH|nr:hypothetical protein VE26_11795 [Devosia chinhatensis]